MSSRAELWLTIATRSPTPMPSSSRPAAIALARSAISRYVIVPHDSAGWSGSSTIADPIGVDELGSPEEVVDRECHLHAATEASESSATRREPAALTVCGCTPGVAPCQRSRDAESSSARRGRSACQGRLRSIVNARSSSSGSLKWRPTICRPIGSPSSEPGRHRDRRVAVQVGRKREPTVVGRRRPRRRRTPTAADPRRRTRHRGWWR